MTNISNARASLLGGDIIPLPKLKTLKDLASIILFTPDPIAIETDEFILLYDRAIFSELHYGEISEEEFLNQSVITGLFRSKENMDHKNGIYTERGSLWYTDKNDDYIKLVDKDRPIRIQFDEKIFTKII